MSTVPISGGLSTGAQAGVIAGVIGGVFLFVTLPIVIFSIYVHRKQKAANRDAVAIDQAIEQTVERPLTQPTPVKTQWVKSIEAVERQRSLAATNTTNDAASETSVEEIQRRESFVPSLPKISITSVVVKPKQTTISTVDLERGPSKIQADELRKTNSSIAKQMQMRAWQAAAVGQWLF